MKPNPQTIPQLPTSKPYYDVLDGLRGLAALVVLVYHYMEVIYWDNYENNFLGHGFLAVDFFFCLSGFVIAFAYDNRIRTLGLKNFFINRLIRLHPLVVLGTLLGFLFYLLNPFGSDPLDSGWGNILLTLLLSLFLIPSSLLKNSNGSILLYNSPMWSLFFEYIANIFYAFFLCRLKKVPLLIFGGLCTLWLGYCAYRSGWIINGWAFQGFSDGFARVAFGFTAGIIVYRCNWTWKTRTGFWLPALLLLSIFCFPHHNEDWLTEFLFVVLILPLILSIGAGASVTGRMKQFCLFLGRLSYPLYMTHYPTVWVYTHYLNQFQPSPDKIWGIAASLTVVNIGIAYLTLRFYDEPVRQWLTRRHKATLKNRMEKSVSLNQTH